MLVLANSGVGQLKTGELTSAVGNPGPRGTLSATMVEQDASAGVPVPPLGLRGGLPGARPGGLASGIPGGLASPRNLGRGLSPAPSFPSAKVPLPVPGRIFSGLGCAQDAIATTYLMSLQS